MSIQNTVKCDNVQQNQSFCLEMSYIAFQKLSCHLLLRCVCSTWNFLKEFSRQLPCSNNRFSLDENLVKPKHPLKVATQIM